MPTATALSNWQFIDAGPLTTTFTAPESCSTELGFTALASSMYNYVFLQAQECEPPDYGGDCLPSGEALDSQRHSSASQSTDPLLYGPIVYYSPGLHCPSGWATAGTAKKNKNGEIETSGKAYEAHLIHTLTDVVTTRPPLVNPPAHIFAQALGLEETAVICCPSDFTPLPIAYGCYSSLDTVIETATVCRVDYNGDYSRVDKTWTYGDETVTHAYMTDVTSLAYETSFETLAASDVSNYDLTPVTFVPMVTLVYQENEDRAPDSNRSNNSGDGNNGDVKDGAIVWDAVGVMTGVVGIAALVGAALL